MKVAIEALRRAPSDSAMAEVVLRAGREDVTNDDIARLACVLAGPGDLASMWVGQPTADVASTGAPSSLSTLLCPLYLLSMGFRVPKLGVPGRPAGGVDTLARIPGYKVSLTREDVGRCIDQCGYAHFLAGEYHAPLDVRFFFFRQRVGAQCIPELAIASILSKKVAVGLHRAVLDIRVAAHGNLGSNWDEARENGRRFSAVAAILGIGATCILTDASVPYQRFLGRGESLLALRNFFSDTEDVWLHRHAAECLAMANSVASHEDVDLANSVRMSSTHFFNNLRAQGSSRDAFETYVAGVELKHNFYLKALRNGFVRICVTRLREVILYYQRLGASKNVAFPDRMGVILARMPGDFVRRGDLLATVRVSEEYWRAAESTLAQVVLAGEYMTRAQGYEEVVSG